MSSSSTDNSPDIYAEVPLAGYTDRLSARPGDTVKFHLSSLAAKPKDDSSIGAQPPFTPVSVKLTRSICADPNPKGPGIIEEDASQWFPPTDDIQVPYQKIPRGSYAQTKSNVSLRLSPCQSLSTPSDGAIFDFISKISVSIWFFPTLLMNSRITSKHNAPPFQTLWQWGDHCRVVVTPSGHLEAPPIGRDGFCRTDLPLKLHRWYRIEYTMELEENRIRTCRLKVDNKLDGNNRIIDHASARESFVPLESFSSIEAPFELAKHGTLNGRLEDPSIRVTGILASSSPASTSPQKYVLAFWNTSVYKSTHYLDPWTIPFRSQLIPEKDWGKFSLILHQHPTRAIKGRNWDGSELCWRHDPSQYGAIHFHDDDVYDFQWDPTFEWIVPQDTPSGVYIMRFQDGSQNQEAVPIFVCPPKQSTEAAKFKTKKKLAVVIPTFTYVMYGNHARPDFEKELWMTRCQSSPGSYPHNPSVYPAYGWSTYNFHSDSSGIHFASHLRPLFNLRPGYITFSRVGGYNDDNPETFRHSQNSFCSGLRHFPADSHLISWLHHQGFDYDIVTDHELHREGASVLAPYTTIMTASHPEYHTLESVSAYQQYRDEIGGNLIYLGGNGFYWRIAAAPSCDGASNEDSCNLLEIRRCESGVRTWAADCGEYYNLLDGGGYGGLWRNSGRPPWKLTGIGFASQGSFVGKPYHRVCFDNPVVTDWVFRGITDTVLGDFGLSGDGAAGYELDRVDPADLKVQDGEIVILAQAHTNQDERFILVPEDVLTPWTNQAGTSNEDAKRADMIYFRVSQSGAQVFSVGSITFCGCLPYNSFDNNISKLIKNVVNKFAEEK